MNSLILVEPCWNYNAEIGPNQIRLLEVDYLVDKIMQWLSQVGGLQHGYN